MRVSQLSKTLDNQLIVDDVTFHLKKGKVTAIIGPNGAGKSTLLSVLSRLLKKDDGKILIHGKELSEWRTEDLAKELSILKQQNVFQVKMTVRELVAFGRFPYSKGRLTIEDEAFIEQALGYLELIEFADRYLDTLSGGQLQRAALGMILVQDTPYILLDEPLNNLDLKQSFLAMKTIKRFADELQKTVVVVIHDINFAAAYADEVIALKKGRIKWMGSVEEVICSEMIQEVYGVEVEVHTINNKKYCLYHTE